MNSYPAKLLLFGEHTVNVGSKALAAPLPGFSAHWQYRPQLSASELASRQMQLPQFAEYLGQLQQRKELRCQMDITSFRQALQNGLTFESDIPTGYGAGSSGALVAAVFDRWSKDSSDWSHGAENFSSDKISDLKTKLAQLESFFHGTSSGTDPLICFLKKPLLLDGDRIQVVNLPVINPDSLQFFLLDTGIERKATPLIEYFLAKMNHEEFEARCQSSLLPAVDEAITSCIKNAPEDLFNAMHQIGAFQLTHLEKLVPDDFKPMWKKGLDGNLFKLKICGAGGGGFLLGLTKDFEVLKKRFPSYRLLQVSIH